MKKHFLKSKALRLSVFFSCVIAALILIFVILFAYVIKQNDRKRQGELLWHIEDSVRDKMQNMGPEMVTDSDFENIPYFVSV